LKDINNIINGCIAGNHSSQIELYDRYNKDLFLTSYRIVQNSGEAEDIMQDSFIKLFERIALYKDTPQMAISALRRIAINASIDRLRRKRLEFLEDMTTLSIVNEEDVDFESIEEQSNAIKKAIALLPKGARIVVTLKAVEGYTFEEIAEQLQITSSTVRSQYVRAKQRILNILKDGK